MKAHRTSPRKLPSRGPKYKAMTEEWLRFKGQLDLNLHNESIHSPVYNVTSNHHQEYRALGGDLHCQDFQENQNKVVDKSCVAEANNTNWEDSNHTVTEDINVDPIDYPRINIVQDNHIVSVHNQQNTSSLNSRTSTIDQQSSNRSADPITNIDNIANPSVPPDSLRFLVLSSDEQVSTMPEKTHTEHFTKEFINVNDVTNGEKEGFIENMVNLGDDSTVAAYIPSDERASSAWVSLLEVEEDYQKFTFNQVFTGQIQKEEAEVKPKQDTKEKPAEKNFKEEAAEDNMDNEAMIRYTSQEMIGISQMANIHSNLGAVCSKLIEIYNAQKDSVQENQVCASHKKENVYPIRQPRNPPHYKAKGFEGGTTDNSANKFLVDISLLCDKCKEVVQSSK